MNPNSLNELEHMNGLFMIFRQLQISDILAFESGFLDATQISEQLLKLIVKQVDLYQEDKKKQQKAQSTSVKNRRVIKNLIMNVIYFSYFCQHRFELVANKEQVQK